MKVAHFTGIRQLEICEQPEPELHRSDAVRLRIDRVGICGSDVHYYLDGRIGNQVVRYPATLGHECSGTVVEAGAAVEGLPVGTRVAVDPAMVCGQCDQCRSGRVNTCRDIQFMGCPGEALGAVAEYRIVPAENCVPIPDTMTLDQAALVEPLSIGLYAVQLSRIARGARIVVLGAGPIGLSVLLCAKATEPCTALVADLIDERLQAARRCGADWIGNSRQTDVVAEILRDQPTGVDLVFECTGDPACIDQAQRLLTPGGTLVIVGIPPVLEVSFDVHVMRRKELTFKNVRRQRGCVAPVIRMIQERQIDPNPLLTHRFSLADLKDAFELVADYRDGVIKAIVELTSEG